MIGANPDELRALAGVHDAKADAVRAAGERLTPEIERPEMWVGPDADAFRAHWHDVAVAALRDLEEELRERGEELRRQAAEQDACSAGRGPAGGPARDRGASAPGPQMAFGDGPQGPIQPEAPSPEDLDRLRNARYPRDVQEAWRDLTPSERAWVIQQNPDLVRNRDGIPLNDRAAANRVAAQRMLNDPNLSEARRRVVQSVANGETKAVYLDPAKGDIIAMYGTPGENTKRVVVHNPATGGKFEDINDGEHLNIPKDLAAKDPDTVVLINQRGPWAQSIADVPGLNTAGGPYANDAKTYDEVGRQLADFQRNGLRTDPYLGRPDVKQIGMGYSYGNSVTTASENHGAHYDQVISIAGANAAPNWHAQPGTRYDNYEYDNDMLNVPASAAKPPWVLTPGGPIPNPAHVLYPGTNPDGDPSWTNHRYGKVDGAPIWRLDPTHSPEANAHRRAAVLPTAANGNENAGLANDVRQRVTAPK